MRVWTTLITATILLVLCVLFQAAEAQNPDPASVLKRYVEALNAGDLDTALAQWAEDGVLTNTRGRRYVGHESLRPFIRQNIAPPYRFSVSHNVQNHGAPQKLFLR